jgi:hypothetical protein
MDIGLDADRPDLRMSRITDFYMGQLNHPSGASIDAIWHWDNGQLEYDHTYIQWLFPLPEVSAAVPHSPILMTKDIERFNDSRELTERLLRSFQLMLGFYGFRLTSVPDSLDQPKIVQTEAFAERARNWLTTGNHNYLRITRILRSMTLLGLAKEAREFFAVLQRVYQKNAGTIGPIAHEYWRNAVRQK